MRQIIKLLIPLFAITFGVCVATADKAPNELRVIVTDHYRIHTDLDVELADDLGRRMDAMWEEYARRLGDFSNMRDAKRYEAYLFAKRIDYMKLSGDRFPNTGGLFLPGRNLLAVFLEGQGRDGIRRTLQHEAFHQFAYTAIHGDMPVWLNEGIAQVFEEGIWTGKQFLIGQAPPRRVQLLQSDIAAHRLTDFRTFMATSDQQWAANMRDKTEATTQYNQAWAMAQFLIYATDDDGHPKYRQRLIDVLDALHHGREGQAAFTSAFGSNYGGFQGAFLEWSHNLRPTAAATYAEHQAILADMLISLGNQGLHFVDIDSFRKRLDEGGYRLRSRTSQDDLPGHFFCDVSGRPLDSSRLFFSTRVGSPAPDIVCRPAEGLQYRTRFMLAGDGMNYETLVEMP